MGRLCALGAVLFRIFGTYNHRHIICLWTQLYCPGQYNIYLISQGFIIYKLQYQSLYYLSIVFKALELNKPFRTNFVNTEKVSFLQPFHYSFDLIKGKPIIQCIPGNVQQYIFVKDKIIKKENIVLKSINNSWIEPCIGPISSGENKSTRTSLGSHKYYNNQKVRNCQA